MGRPARTSVTNCWLKMMNFSRFSLERLPPAGGGGRAGEGGAARWGLEIGEPFRTGYASWCAPTSARGGRDAVLKIVFPHDEARHEARALRAWDGRGAVRLLDDAPEDWALLLEHVRPGTPMTESDATAEERLAAGADVHRELCGAPADPDSRAVRDLQEALPSIVEVCRGWSDLLADRAARAAVEGDLDLDPGLLALAGEEPLPEVVGYWGELFGVETARELGALGAGGDLFCDGSLGSHTAALHEPYTDRPETCGALRFDTADLAEHIVRCTEAGLQAGFHAIGDAAVDQVLDAVDLVTARLGRTGGAGHRIEHAELVRDPDRLARSGLLASMQPAFDATWGGPAGMYADRLGATRALEMNRFAELSAAGAPFAFGSDSPVTPLAPWAAVRAAAHPSDPGAAISPRSAFAAHTQAGWRAAGRDGEGVLTPGSPATFAAWRAGELSSASGLPDVSPGLELPDCVHAVVRGRTNFDAGLRRG